jgi:MFS family permease
MSLKQLYGSFSREVWILFAGTMINRFGSFVLVFLILYLTRQGFSPAQAGVAVAAYGVGGIGASLAGGHLADRLGRRRTIALSMFSAAVVILALGQARSLASITIWTALMGLTAELYRPASSALLADLTRAGDRVTAYAGYRLAVNFGAMVGPAVGGFLAESSFSWLFIGDAVTCAAFGLIALVALPEGRRIATHEEHAQPRRSIFADRAFVMMLIASTAIAFVYAQSHSGFALEIAGRGWSSAVYGGLIALNAFIVLLLELPISAWTRHRAPRPTIALGMALLGVGFGLVQWLPSAAWLTVAVLVWTLGEIVSAPVAAAYVSDIAPDHMRGRYQGAWTLTWGLGFVIGPSLGGRLFAWGPAALWGTCLGLGFAAALLVMISHPAVEVDHTADQGPAGRP